MWVVIYIQLLFPSPGIYYTDTQILGQYKTMEKCFHARELYILDTGRIDGYPKVNTQVVCIRVDKDTNQ